MSTGDAVDPEHQALLADSVGLALLVVLDSLDPAERLALVLHDMFAVPFDEIAPIVGRTPTAARQLASRARREVQGGAPEPDPDLTRQRKVVDAWLAASRAATSTHWSRCSTPTQCCASTAVARRRHLEVRPWRRGDRRQALMFPAAGALRPARAGQRNRRARLRPGGRPSRSSAFTISDGRIPEIDILADPAASRPPPLMIVTSGARGCSVAAVTPLAVIRRLAASKCSAGCSEPPKVVKRKVRRLVLTRLLLTSLVLANIAP